jgi:hypothetical protein
MMSDVRWTEQMHIDRVELELRSSVTHVREHVMLRRMMALTFYVFGQMLPAGDPNKAMFQQYGQLPTPAALAELEQQAQAYVAADALAVQARADSALLSAALDYEDWRAQQAALTPLPVPDPDTGIMPDDPLTPDERAAVEAQRASLQSQMDGAAQATKDLVAQRDAYRASLLPPPPPEVPQEPAP